MPEITIQASETSGIKIGNKIFIGKFTIHLNQAELNLTKRKNNQYVYLPESALSKLTGIGNIIYVDDNQEINEEYLKARLEARHNVYEGDIVNSQRQGEGTFYFPNGDRYQGKWENDQKHGEGTLYFANGDRYKGEWKNNQKAGKGILYFANGEQYKGEWRENKKHGEGILYFANGDHYKGKWQNNEREGLGTLYLTNNSIKEIKAIFKESMFKSNEISLIDDAEILFANGDSYTGKIKFEYKDGNYHINLFKGTLTFSDEGPDERKTYKGSFNENNQPDGDDSSLTFKNGTKYSGPMRDGYRHGKGTYYCINGDYYEAQWKNDQISEIGPYHYANNGGYYEGEWKDTMPHGVGAHYHTDGHSYKGDWKNGRRHGKGVVRFADGSHYEGDWQNDQRHGWGVMHFANNKERYEGEWKNNQYHGTGTIYLTDGGRYEGKWENGQLNGEGIFSYVNGDRYEGKFKDGQRHGQGILFFNTRFQLPTPKLSTLIYPDFSSSTSLCTRRQLYVKMGPGDCYEGKWEKGIIADGTGILTKKNGKRFELEIKSGIVVKQKALPSNQQNNSGIRKLIEQVGRFFKSTLVSSSQVLNEEKENNNKSKTNINEIKLKKL